MSPAEGHSMEREKHVPAQPSHVKFWEDESKDLRRQVHDDTEAVAAYLSVQIATFLRNYELEKKALDDNHRALLEMEDDITFAKSRDEIIKAFQKPRIFYEVLYQKMADMPAFGKTATTVRTQRFLNRPYPVEVREEVAGEESDFNKVYALIHRDRYDPEKHGLDLNELEEKLPRGGKRLPEAKLNALRIVSEARKGLFRRITDSAQAITHNINNIVGHCMGPAAEHEKIFPKAVVDVLLDKFDAERTKDASAVDKLRKIDPYTAPFIEGGHRKFSYLLYSTFQLLENRIVHEAQGMRDMNLMSFHAGNEAVQWATGLAQLRAALDAGAGAAGGGAGAR